MQKAKRLRICQNAACQNAPGLKERVVRNRADDHILSGEGIGLSGTVLPDAAKPVFAFFKARDRKTLERQGVAVDHGLSAFALGGPAAGKVCVRRQVEALAEVRVFATDGQIGRLDHSKAGMIQ